MVALLACDPGDVPGPNGGSYSLSQIMGPTEYFDTSVLLTSESGKYMLINAASGSDYDLYLSKDGGESFEGLPLNFDPGIGGNISNDGLWVSNRVAMNLETGTTYPLTTYSAWYQHLVLASGQMVSVQKIDGVFQIMEYQNDDFVQTGIEVMDVDFIAGISGDQIAFFDSYHRTYGIYDHSTRTFTQHDLSSINLRQLGAGVNRRSNERMAFSQGYLAVALEGGCVVVAPDLSPTYYFYPEGYANYLNGAAIVMEGSRIWLGLYNYQGERTVFSTEGGTFTATDYHLPIKVIDGALYTTGFLENGDRAYSGLIKYQNGVGTYLGANIEDQVNSIQTAFLLKQDVYFNDKIYDRDQGTYRSSPLEKIQRMIYEDNRVVAYTDYGTYVTYDDGATWEKTENTLQPLYVVKAEDGTYYGMTVGAELVYLGNTGFSVTNYSHTSYTSTDVALGWDMIPGTEKEGLGGKPIGLSSDGITIHRSNLNTLGNAVWVTKVSTDYGANYVTYNEGETVPEVYSSLLETADGRKVNVGIMTAGDDTGITLVFVKMKNNKASTYEIPLPAESISRTSFSFTAKEELLVWSGDEIFLSNPL